MVFARIIHKVYNEIHYPERIIVTEEEQADLALKAIYGVVAVGTIAYAVNVIKHARRRRKIHSWKMERIATIANAQDRITAFAESPDFDLAEFNAILAEETAFMEIINNIPPY